MKKLLCSWPIMLLAVSILLLQSCVKDTLTTTHVAYEPVYKAKADVLAGIKSSGPTVLMNTGKLALYGNYILVNEINKGVHVIDNSNPASPVNKAFIEIPGNLDLAVKDNILYADIFTDLVTIDISNISNAALKQVDYNVFPERQYSGNFTGDTSQYIVDWIKHETRERTEIDRNQLNIRRGTWMEGDALFQTYSTAANAATKSYSIGGSMARFTIVNDHLYTVGRSSLTAIDVSNAANPVIGTSKPLGWNIETIFPLNDKLFIGSQTGMFIFNLDNPADPSLLGNFSHACFGDPVIANERYAFVTLKALTGVSQCWGVAPQRNEMDIVDITTINQPVLTKVYDMEEPQGLSLDGNNLFICDGKGGLKIYNVADVLHLQLLQTFTDINPFDVIAYNGIAIVVAKEGIIQYDYHNINAVRKLSTINISKQ